MKKLEQFLRQTQNLLRNSGIHPLVMALGLLFCLFFPRFFFLAAFGYGIYWVAKNIWRDPRHNGSKKGRKRR